MGYQRELIAMKKLLANWTRLAVVVAVIAGTQSGCKSGWKMPGADLFSWSKKPSESTLAGSSPNLSMPSSGSSPVSPASKSTPSALASTGAKSPYGTGSTGPSFSMPNTNAPVLGGAGTAAAQNGYTNGQYGMVSANARPGGAMPSYPGSPNSGYGGAGYPQASSAVASSMPNAGAKPGYPPSNALAGATSLPPAYGPQGTPSMPTSMPQAYTSPNTVSAMPAGYTAGPSMGQPMPPAPSSMPNAVPGGYQPTMPSVATQPYNGTTPYKPGSVGRSTGYDFSAPGSGVNSGATQTGYGLPPAVPATANGYNGQTYR